MANKIILTASGGGHTGYAVALAQYLHDKCDLTFIIPKGDEWSKAKVEKYGKVIEITKGRGPKDPAYKFFPRFTYAFFESLSKIGKYEVIVSSGSNHSIPPSIICKLKGAKLINIESPVRFVSPSKTAKLLDKIADMTVIHWEQQKKLFRNGVVVGPIVEKPLYEAHDGGYILVTGGTYGHKYLFDEIIKIPIDNIVLQTGRISPEEYKKARPNWKIFQFDPDFQKWIAGASLVISHFGRTAVDAAISYRKPVVIVPNPEWRRTAGMKDAEQLAIILNAVLVKEVKASKILEAIDEAKHRKPPQYPNGAERLAEIILQEL